ncbi:MULTISPECIES: hypothetical protein [unclassified Treponema]|uniref:InlB B-repeat-containing protein n=1 Tax=unclassified Treponema TaxID=2638727 RepID=UPI0020A2F6CB|nr:MULTISPECIES: hypothetical protein [unclassified Treponema]UTC67339.1 hypothetical protein E4O06_01315 [Treponema sp. OMZ 789]UTC70067.1 hypothetical protein E4O01_01310 [Treponema sp. OMZ 790]UTC72783.1 hypothetical protein E4O02_01310 [Treponema sp. OMZ 791]
MKNICVIKTKLIKRFASLIFIGLVLTLFNSCRPALGSSWYPRTSDDTGMSMYITEILISDNPVIAVLSETPIDEIDRLKKFSAADTYIVTVPPSVDEIYVDNIKVNAVSSLSKKEPVLVDVKINGEGTPLVPGQTVPITIKIIDNAGKYSTIEKIIKITQSEPYNLELKSLEICGIDAISGAVTVPYKYSVIDPSKITAKFKYGENETVIPVDIENSPVELKENETVNIKIMVKGKKGQYKDFQKDISITREAKTEGEDEALQLLEMYILGIKAEIGKTALVPENTQTLNSDDVILSFKKFGYIPAEISPKPAVFGNEDIVSLKLSVAAKEGKYQAWEMDITVKKSSEVLYNPIDKKGNKKYVIQINTILENIDPFVYYDENYEFHSSKFDDWVLYMPSMSGIIASYKFTPGTWTGIPNVCNNVPDEIGSGLKAIDNIKIYRYKTRADRWAKHGGYVPNADPNDSRFYFYRFTANASAGIKADNSMFCVDRYSKFLFYYSDPSYLKNIFGNIVPQNWVDYATPTSGDHVQFGKPFYMSDPVGYVKEDGSVVMYQWIKDNINASNYHAQENSIFTKPAEKKPNGAGFSPYRNPIEITKTEVTKEINPKYTVSEPVIMGQPSSIYAHVGDSVYFEIKVLPAPSGEILSYQWYKRSKIDGSIDEKIDGAIQAKYVPDTSAEIDAYCYCIIQNKNTANGKITEVKSEEVKFRLVPGSGQIIIDAEPPKILKQPEGASAAIGSSEEISLSVIAESVDGGNLTYQWFKADNETDEGSPINNASAETYKFVPTTASEHNEFYYCVITNTNTNVSGNTTAIRKSMRAKIAVEALYSIIFSVSGDEGGTLTALYKGKPINSGDYVKKGDKVRFIATPDAAYYIKQWVGAEPVSSMPDLTIADLIVPDQNVFVSVAFERRMRLKITPKIYNESLKSWSTADGDHFNHKYIKGVHLAHNFKIKVESDSPELLKSWNRKFNVENNGGKWIKVDSADFVDTAVYKSAENGFLDNIYNSFTNMKITLSNHLIKANRHDYWWAEWTTLGGGTVYPLQAIDDNSSFPLIYNEASETWTVDTANVQIKQSVEIPLPQEYEGTKPDPNRKISYKNVTITYDQDFTLTAGEEKDFVITYTVNNPDTKSEGTIKVIYTISWK